MRPVIYSINVTLDGCVDHREALADLELHRHAEDRIAQADALLFGRITYQMMEGAWRPPASDAMPGWAHSFARTIDEAKKYVVSNTLNAVDWNAELLRGDLGAAVRGLKEEPGEGILTGGVTLPAALARLGLIDEYEFIVHPRVVNKGPRLLAGLPVSLDLALVGCQPLDSGAVAMRYAPK